MSICCVSNSLVEQTNFAINAAAQFPHPSTVDSHPESAFDKGVSDIEAFAKGALTYRFPQRAQMRGHLKTGEIKLIANHFKKRNCIEKMFYLIGQFFANLFCPNRFTWRDALLIKAYDHLFHVCVYDNSFDGAQRDEGTTEIEHREKLIFAKEVDYQMRVRGVDYFKFYQTMVETLLRGGEATTLKGDWLKLRAACYKIGSDYDSLHDYIGAATTFASERTPEKGRIRAHS